MRRYEDEIAGLLYMVFLAIALAVQVVPTVKP